MNNKKYIWTFWTGQMGYKVSFEDLLYLSVSIELVKKISQDVVVYTDSRGLAEIERNNIDVDKVVLDFNIPEAPVPRLAQAKLMVMSLQKDPFFHIDHDVFLLKELPQYNNVDLVTQNLEFKPLYGSFYKIAVDNAIKQNITLPEELLSCINKEDYSGYNCGYLDAQNLDLIAEWTQKALKLSETWTPYVISDNIFVQQMLLYAIAKSKPYKIGTLLGDGHPDSINQIANELGYVHLMGAKNSENLFDQDQIFKSAIQKLKNLNPNTYSKFLDNYSYISEYEN